MNIIKGPEFKVEVPLDWWHGRRNRCELCGTVVELTAKSPVSFSNPTYSGSVYVHFDCPNCGKSACISEDKSRYIKPLKKENKLIRGEIIVVDEEQPKRGLLQRLLRQ
jgi:predicted RNA-binding Zn-ribbon protein involved in translation (DUF1610 family)